MGIILRGMSVFLILFAEEKTFWGKKGVGRREEKMKGGKCQAIKDQFLILSTTFIRKNVNKHPIV